MKPLCLYDLVPHRVALASKFYVVLGAILRYSTLSLILIFV